MPANLTFDALKAAVSGGEIDTVLTCIVDMQGRLMGKRFHAQHFIDSGHDETHCCNYLVATDLEMITVQGYKATSWAAGYGDYVIKPDLATLRLLPWLAGTPVDGATVARRMRGLQALGDPYSDAQIQQAPADVQGKTELDAVVAYLQGLGKHAPKGG